MVPCPRCHFMNPLKQRGCQACGATLPFALAETQDPTKGQTRATLRGLRSPDSPTDGLTPAELEAMKGELPPVVPPVPKDGTMPSFSAPTPDAINKHRDSIATTILGHATPKPSPLGAQGPHSAAPLTPKDPPFSPRSRRDVEVQVGSQASVANASADEASRAAFAGRTLLGHQVPSQSPATSDTQSSPTLPSMQAVVPDSESRSKRGTQAPSSVPPEVVSFRSPNLPYENEASQFLAYDEGPIDSPALTSSSRSTPATPRSFRFQDVPAQGDDVPYSTSSQGPFGVVAPVSRAVARRLTSPESVRAANVRMGRRVLIIASALLVALSLFALLWTPPEPPTARLVGVGEQTMLELTCNTCDDGSQVMISGQKATFSNHRASVPMPKPLNLGLNDIEIEIQRTGFGRNERMGLQFPIDYRLAWDLSQLEAIPPTLRVVVEAALGVTVSLDGQPVPLADNKGLHPVPIAADLIGPSTSEQWLEKSVSVAISGGRASTPPDQFTLKIPIVPLAVDTPWEGFLTADDTTVVSGRSTPNTKITVAGNPTTTNADGYFELALQTSAGLNQFTVSAHAPGHAPRFVNVSLTKVPSAHKAALEYQGTAINRFDEVFKQLQAPEASVRVALPGRVQESKVQGSTTVLLVSVTAGCPNRSCVVRVIYPSRLELRPGERVAVFGPATLAAAGPTPQSRLPEIRAHMLLR